MPMVDVSIEELIPHRRQMKLIDEIVEVDEETAVTESVVKDHWPLFRGDSVSPFILIELAAQTAGVFIGWKELKKEGRDLGGSKGWLVGIKEASFCPEKISLDSRIRVSSRKKSSFEAYHEVVAIAEIGSQVVGEVELQIIHSGFSQKP